MSREVTEGLGWPMDKRGGEGGATIEGAGMSRRRALPLIGAAVAVASGCNLGETLLGVDPEAEADRLRQQLAAARVHRGGIERFALRTLSPNVAVTVEQAGTKKNPDLLTVTVYETDPETGVLIREAGDRRTLEVHRHLSNATISQIESPHVLFYYLHGS